MPRNRVGNLNILNLLFFVLSLMMYLLAAVEYITWQGNQLWLNPLAVSLLSIILFTLGLIVFEILTSNTNTYFILLSAHSLALFFLVPFLAGRLEAEYGLYLSLIIGIGLHNPFPISAYLGLASYLILLIIRTGTLWNEGLPIQDILGSEAKYTALCALIAGLVILVVHYREKYLTMNEANRVLDSSLDRLTRANLQYQEYAITVEEESIDLERKRITREIHDIVGYTLINNITMMEAITDMMRHNPLGVPHLVDIARDNAQDGLTRIREALYLLRKTESPSLNGLAAVQKLISIFKRGTGVHVELFLSNQKWEFSENLDSAFYHVVQEGLINAFLHGKATKVNLFLVRHSDAIELRVSDNGLGSLSYSEGIGLSGMRERLSKLGGSLTAITSGLGFTVVARSPLEGRNE